jgi:ankyrin repeat protein
LIARPYFRHEEVVRLLLEKGADLDSKNAYYGRTPLAWPAENGRESVARLLAELQRQREILS